MLSTIVRRHFLSLAMAPAVRSEPSLNSMGEMLIFLQMRDSILSLAVLAAPALHVQCVRQRLEMTMKKHAQAWRHRMETGKVNDTSSEILAKVLYIKNITNTISCLTAFISWSLHGHLMLMEICISLAMYRMLS